ncbi:MFS transporter [Streptomyces sp. NPDC001351]|uniref:MFS transporter n=1 Tax=Streptomyces sp. NPDC001351 TaxID=3364564 RepID=UPI0036A44AE7
MRILQPPDLVTRRLAWVTLVNTVGNGLLVSTIALYLVRFVGLSAGDVALGASVSSLSGLVASVLIGRLADRRDPRMLLIALTALQGLGTATYLFVQSLSGYLATSAVVGACAFSSVAVRNTLVGRILSPTERVGSLAYLRAVTNAGMGAGSCLTLIAVSFGTLRAFQLTIAVDVLTFAAAVLLLTQIAPVGRSGKIHDRGERGSINFSNLRFLLFAIYAGALYVHSGLMDTGIALWVTLRTTAPDSTIGITLAMESILVVLLQVRMSRGITTNRQAGLACLYAAFLLVLACALFALSAALSDWLAGAVVILGGVAHVGGEILLAAGTWTLSFSLAPRSMVGRYQGIFTGSQASARMFAPLLITVTAINLGAVGWAVLAAWFAVFGALVWRVAAQTDPVRDATLASGTP